MSRFRQSATEVASVFTPRSHSGVDESRHARGSSHTSPSEGRRERAPPRRVRFAPNGRRVTRPGLLAAQRLYSDGAVPIERSRSRSHLPHVALTERQGSDTSRPLLLERAKLLV